MYIPHFSRNDLGHKDGVMMTREEIEARIEMLRKVFRKAYHRSENRRSLMAEINILRLVIGDRNGRTVGEEAMDCEHVFYKNDGVPDINE